MTTPADKAAHQPVPRYRTYTGPAVFAHGFRAFFFAAGCWAALAMVLWVLAWRGAIVLPTAFAPPVWHAHELVFGYGVAAVTGFLLTAIPNWTGRFPLQGRPLAALVLLWLAGRIAAASSAMIGPAVAAIIDVAFLIVLCGFVVREILAGRNWRNLPMPVALAFLAVANAATHVDTLSAYGLRGGIAILAALIGLVGGRIVPSFTRNWLARQGAAEMPAPFGTLDRLMLALLVIAFALWVSEPDWAGTGVAAGAAGIATVARFGRWRAQDTAPEPLLWVLHLGYFWLAVGLGLIAAVPAWGVPPIVAIHALTAGAIGTMTLAVMTRASLGHSGRALTADAWTTLIYVLVTGAALARIAAHAFATNYAAWIDAAGGLWIAAFTLFAVRYAPILLSRKAG
jgi:uncharacterized protein involved in response to NO